MAENLAKEFRDLADRFLRLRSDDLPDADGNHHTFRLAAKAGKAAYRAAGVLQFPPDFPWPEGPFESPVVEESAWESAWIAISTVIGGDAGAIRKRYRGDGVTFGRSHAKDWKQRCEDWGSICRTLADAIDQPLDPHPEDPDQLFSVPALAKKYEIDQEKLRKRLDYWRGKNLGSKDWTEIENRAENDPKYLYRFGAIEAIVNSLKSDA